MKFLVLLSILTSHTAFAGFKYPKGVYMPDQVEEAIASAKELNKPLFILNTNNNSN